MFSNFFIWLTVTGQSFIKLPGTLNLNIFADTLVLLCILVSLICWVILSERFLLKNYFNLSYFLSFTLFTINMVYTGNLLVMFLFFEFIFLPSLFFVYTAGYAKRVDKTIKFLLLWTLLGSLLVLFGLVYLYSISLTLHFKTLLTIVFTKTEQISLLLIFFIGFGVKLPVWPFHYWLTKVHVEAPAGFSIFLSGFLVKTALYCFYPLYILFSNLTCKYIIISITLWGILDASFRMWAVIDIKRLIAFATIQEMNLILLFLILSVNTSYLLLNLFILVHGILSALFFFLIDQVQKRFQTRNIFSLSGLNNYTTVLPLVIWLSLLIFRGFPLFIKFFIEWELLILVTETFYYFGLVFFFLTNLFAILGFSRVFLIILYGVTKYPKLVYMVDILKKDLVIITFLFSILFVLNMLLWVF